MTEQWTPKPPVDLPLRPDPQGAPPPVDNVIDLFAAKERLHAQNAGDQIPTPPTGPTEPASFFAVREKNPLPLLTPPSEPRRLCVRVRLNDSAPPIWRSLSLPSDIRLDRLHEVIQVAIGWEDTHLHQFTTAGDPLGYETEGILTPFALAEGDVGVMESDLRLDQFLAEPGDLLHYTYDFGDGWDHTLTLDLVEPDSPDAAVRCLDGARNGPPEDVGGMFSYDHLLTVAAHSGHPDREQWLPTIRALNLRGFVDEIDLGAINRGLARLDLADAGLDWLDLGPAGANHWDGPDAAGLDHAETTEPWFAAAMVQSGIPREALRAMFTHVGVQAQRFFAGYVGAAMVPQAELPHDAVETATMVIRRYLMHLGDGITLTAAGFLPPARVRTLMKELDPDRSWLRPANRESAVYHLGDLREAVVALGLARKLRGVLVPTKLGRSARESPEKMWQAIAARLPLERTPVGREIAFLVLMVVGAGEATGFVKMRADLDKFSSILGWEIGGGGRYGNDSAYAEAMKTVDVLSWAGTGRLLPGRGQSDELSLPGAVLLARAALRD
ncbi:plasmid pRiA4b ORF-3 family protein [Cryobacterium melibiosiphilum]|uniref:Plasmid pRiA4b ORF-3 family protein n=1 Tax=Cryobacterium melibiosiphilum TaxID=995039 RepID=A0A3A5MIY3_9MICO|nr:plasmid pRiA4b ORF-3 family protein [Cryobacterium melibiosiphilum]RJT89005.1 plasmid pRiA4b ORF-3 family protein [Cryobacterium melibiosiphilum]